MTKFKNKLCRCIGPLLADSLFSGQGDCTLLCFLLISLFPADYIMMEIFITCSEGETDLLLTGNLCLPSPQLAFALRVASWLLLLFFESQFLRF